MAESATDSAGHRALRLVIFSSSDAVRHTLRSSFETRGHVVQTIAVSELRWPLDGVRRLIDDIKAQVVVYDVAMPFVSHWDLLNAIRLTDRFDTPVVVTTTADPTTLDSIVGEHTGAFHVTGSPENLSALLNIVCDAAARGPSTFPVLSRPDSMRPPTRPPVAHSVHQWLDMSIGLAYIVVGPQLKAFSDFLHAIEELIERPAWRPGIPVVEDLRQCQWIPPTRAVEEWRAYVAGRQPQLGGCRWAVVTRGDNSSVVSILDAAAHDAAPNGVTLRRFTSMVDAHLWVKPPASLPSR